MPIVSEPTDDCRDFDRTIHVDQSADCSKNQSVVPAEKVGFREAVYRLITSGEECVSQEDLFGFLIVWWIHLNVPFIRLRSNYQSPSADEVSRRPHEPVVRTPHGELDAWLQCLPSESTLCPPTSSR